MPDGCRCRECFGLAEYMEALTGSDHGLPRAPGHAPPRPAESSLELTKSQFDALQAVKRRVGVAPEPSQPWEPKPPRRRRSTA